MDSAKLLSGIAFRVDDREFFESTAPYLHCDARDTCRDVLVDGSRCCAVGYTFVERAKCSLRNLLQRELFLAAVGRAGAGRRDGELGGYDRGCDRLSVLVPAEFEGLELEPRDGALRLIVTLDDLRHLGGLPTDLHHDVDIPDVGVATTCAAVLVFPG